MIEQEGKIIGLNHFESNFMWWTMEDKYNKKNMFTRLNKEVVTTNDDDYINADEVVDVR